MDNLSELQLELVCLILAAIALLVLFNDFYTTQKLLNKYKKEINDSSKHSKHGD